MSYIDKEIENLERKMVKLNDEERAIYDAHLKNLKDRLAKIQGAQGTYKPTAAFDFGPRDNSTGEFI
jgi:hypothetical protein